MRENQIVYAGLRTTGTRLMIQTAICDDDAIQLERIEATLSRFASERGVSLCTHPFDNPQDMLARVREMDILFMDVDFDGEPQGIDIVRQVNDIAPDCQVVFVTNYPQFALDVYKVDHVWYLVKSQLIARLPEVFDKLLDVIDERHAKVIITTKDDNRIVSIPCIDIWHLERKQRATTIVTANGNYLVRDKIVAIMDKLPVQTFARCHNSYVVALPHVQEVRSAELLLENGTCIPISRSYSKSFRNHYLAWAASRSQIV